jgi:hypothetical protein
MRRRSPGYFTLYEKEEKVWIELKPEQLNTPFYLSINRTRGLGENFVYPFMVRGYVVEFRKIGPLVQMIAKNTRFGAKAGTPLALAAEQSFTDSLLSSTTVASQPHPERKSILIEANGLFLTDIPGTATQLEAAYRAPYSFDQRNSSFTKVRATSDMATFAVSAHFAIPKVPAPPQTPNPASPPVPLPGTLEDVRSMFLGYHYSLAKLPDEPMATRTADPRIGHFMTRHHEYTNDVAPFPRQYFVNRWRLEKKDPAAALSEPKQPIVFWLDRNIPLEYRDTVKAASSSGTRPSSAWASRTRSGRAAARERRLRHGGPAPCVGALVPRHQRWRARHRPVAHRSAHRRDPRCGHRRVAGLDAPAAPSHGEQFPRPMPTVPAIQQGEERCAPTAPKRSRKPAFATGLLEARGDLDPSEPRSRSHREGDAEGRHHARGRTHAGPAPQLPRLHHLHGAAARGSRSSPARTAWAAP